MRPGPRSLALLVGAALAVALVVLVPRIDGAEPSGGPDAAAAVRDVGLAGREALHRTGAQAPERALLLLAVLPLVGAVVASSGQTLAPHRRPVSLSRVLVVRTGVRGPPPPTRSTAR
jgi:hypothetical protein